MPLALCVCLDSDIVQINVVYYIVCRFLLSRSLLEEMTAAESKNHRTLFVRRTYSAAVNKY